MALPRAIQEQADAADAVMAQFAQTGNPAVDPETGEPIQTAPPAPQAPPKPEAAVTPPAPAPQEPSEPKWEQKYHTLKGMFDAEVPRLNDAVRQLQQQLNAIAAENQQLKTAAPAPAPAAPTPLVTDQDRESFGADLVGLIERATTQATTQVRTELGGEIQRLKAENTQLKSQVGSVSQQTAANTHDSFIERLGQRVPNLATVNVDPGFLSWLQQVDPIYGIPRQMALDNAASKFDVIRAAAIFDAYLATVTPPAPNVSNTPPANELERQVTPPRSRNTPPPPQEVKRAWTSAGINQFYADVRRGVYTEEQAAQLEAEIYAAAAEGRVQG
jgi:hypothetical protein